MNWFTEFFGGADKAAETVDKVTTAMINGIDKVIYTKEEKEETKTERFKLVYDFVTKTFDENSVRNVTRRWMAWGVTGFILFNAQLCIVLYLMGRTEQVKGIIEIVNAFMLGEAFVGIMVAYFGVQFVRGRSK